MSTPDVESLVDRGLDAERASRLLATLLELESSALSLPERWRALTARALGPDVPFPVHQWAHDRLFAGWDPAAGPRPVWSPTPAEAARTNLAALLAERGLRDYPELHAWSVADRAGFWGWAVTRLGLRFEVPPQTILDDGGGPEHPRWLVGARYNIAASCFAAEPTAPALLWGGPDGALHRLSYAELQREVARVAAALEAAGFRPGDPLAIDMPMTPEAVVLYLGIVAAGMVVVSIADALAPEEVATRLRIARAAGIFTVWGLDRGGKHLPLYPKLLGIDLATPEAPLPRAVVLGAPPTPAPGASPPRLRPQDLAWDQFLALAPPGAAWRPRPSDPDAVTNLLFSSGTTGEPKAIPWTQLTPIKAAIDGTLHLDVQPGDVVAWPTNLGWMMGPWLIYASLLNRATIALFLDAPTGRPFGEFVARARVNVLGLVPSIVKAWRSDDRMLGLDWSSLKCFGSTGEASNPVDYHYLMMLAGYRPVIEYCGGTEIGGGYLTGTLLQPAAPATFSTPALGSALVLLDEAGRPTDNGEVFLVPPTLGYSLTLLNRDHHQVYFEGTPPGPDGQLLRRHGDQIERLPGGYYRALGRVDDTMNLGGIKVSSAEIERLLDTVPGVSRSAAIAVNPAGGGPSELVVYLVPAPGAAPDPGAARAALLAPLQQAIKTRLNPLFRISDVVVVDTLPVTPSNKIMRRELRAAYERRR